MEEVYLEFFFFQAEDGIRDGHVTGVQTCALPISDSVTSRSINLSVSSCDRWIRTACNSLPAGSFSAHTSLATLNGSRGSAGCATSSGVINAAGVRLIPVLPIAETCTSPCRSLAAPPLYC